MGSRCRLCVHVDDEMKVDRASRGGKKGSLCGREDIVVTVPNQESAESRLKPPVVSSHPRKIILNQNKTGIWKVFTTSLRFGLQVTVFTLLINYLKRILSSF